jgi:hypothetical protein
MTPRPRRAAIRSPAKSALASTSTNSGARCERLFENPSPVLFGPLEEPVLPGRPAGDDDGTAPAVERAGHVRTVHRVEAHLDDVGAGRGVAIATDFAHRAAGDRPHISCELPINGKRPLQQ